MRGAIAVAVGDTLTVFNGEYSNGTASLAVFKHSWSNTGSWNQEHKLRANEIKPKVVLPYNY